MARTLLLVGCLCLLSGAGVAHRPLPSAPPVYGVTIDRITHLAQIRAGLAALPEPATVRVVFDRAEPPAYYAWVTARLAGVSSVMGELLDSSQERSITPTAMESRARAYLRKLGGSIAIWEVGNELNGDWTGRYSQVAAKTRAAFSVILAAHRATAITLYANDFGPDHCGDGAAELTPTEFARRYLAPRLRARLDYLLLSYYPTQCGGVEPSATALATDRRALHGLFPNARLGFGETGLPNPVTPATTGRAREIMHWAYGLNPRLPYYVGGYFWWYGAEDALLPRAPLRSELAGAFAAEHKALRGG